MAKTFYIFRHGLTNAVKTGTSYGDSILTAPMINEAEAAPKSPIRNLFMMKD